MKTERCVYREPMRLEHIDRLLPVEKEEYIQFEAIKTDSALIEVSELDRVIPIIKRNMLTKLVKHSETLVRIEDVKGLLKSELRKLKEL